MSLLGKLFKKEVKREEDSRKSVDVVDKIMLQDFLKCESVYRHQAIVFPRFSKDKPATIGGLIKALFPACDGKIREAVCLTMEMFGANPRTAIISDFQEIEGMKPVESSLYTDDEGKTLPITGLNHVVLISFTEEAPLKEILFHFRVTGGLYCDSAYMRVSVMIPPLGKQEDFHSGTPGAVTPLSGTNCAADQFSFLIVEDFDDNREMLARYDAVEAEVKRKLKRDAELTDLERCVYVGFNAFKPLYEYVSYGRLLAGQNRWFDAYRQFVRAWHISPQAFRMSNDEEQSWYYSLAYEMGKCLVHLDRLDEASYFLKLASGKEKEAIVALADVYARLGDVRVPDKFARIQEVYKNKLREATEKPYVFDSMTVGDALAELFGVIPGSLTCMALRNDNKEDGRIVNESKEVWNTPLSLLAKDGTTAIIMYCPVGYITGNESDASKLCFDSTIVIRVHKVQTGKDDGLFRMNVMLPAFNLDSDKLYLRNENIPAGMSVLFGTVEPPKECEPLWPCSALAKSGRFLETCRAAKYIFSRLLSRWEVLSDDEKEDFFESAFWIGFSYMDFRLMEKAEYYLDIAAQSNYVKYMKEYLNCLSNCSDPRAMSVIDSYMRMSREESTPKEEVHRWMSFLKRRKVYVLVEAGEYDAAKEILFELICDSVPENRVFAKHELDYIEECLKKR